MANNKKVEVVVRLRPLVDEEESCVEVIDGNTVDIVNFRNSDEHLRYSFSKVYDQSASQADVFEGTVEQHINSVMNGQNASILAYGPTGAGKTHTILGRPEDPGIIPRTVKKLFDLIEKEKTSDSECTYTTHLSFLEIYNERVIDLLQKKPFDLQIREDQKHVIQVPGLAEKEISNYDQFNSVFGPASQNRTVASTKLNEYSSRSHSIMLLKIVKKIEKRTYSGKLYIIDLAGSENNKRTGNQGIRLRESGAINNSLFALGKVVDALTQHLPRIPYRDSKLTRLLQDSFGGNSNAVLIANLCPAMPDYMLTYATLNFASKTKTIVNKPTVHEVIEKPTTIKRHSGTLIQIPEKKARQELRQPQPALSPLLKNQKNVQKQVDSISERLGSLEKTLLDQIKGSGNTDDKYLNEAVAKATAIQLKVVKEQLFAIKKENEQVPDYKQDSSTSLHRKGPKVAKVIPRKRGTGSEDSKENKSSDEEHTDNRSPVSRERPKRGKKTLMEDPLDASPSSLFVNDSAVFIKKRKFRTTALKLSSDENSPSAAVDIFTPKKSGKQLKDSLKNIFSPTPRKPVINPDVQQKHNCHVLSILNSGTLKGITKLITVGKKRAQMIISYRDLCGQFEQVEDLKNVPGLSKNFLKNFLKGNLVQ
ncbi:kinesin-like protein KIF22 [Lineus longissimus]|uniref:kinesin-like protein KIF22 n=1 Tax=Lineus longissimus TaxID=88925 RepID=UPI002B4DC6E4